MSCARHSPSKAFIRITAVVSCCLLFPCHADFVTGVTAYKQRDYQLAFAQFAPLADAGDARAQFALGLIYDNGEGVTADGRKARAWYLASAEQEYAKAQV